MLDSDLFVEPKELLEVKRVQIRAGRANEAVLVKRLSERLQRDLDRQGVLYLFLFGFLDALASLDLKLSVSQSVSESLIFLSVSRSVGE